MEVFEDGFPLHAQALVLAPQTAVFSRQIRTGRRDRRLRSSVVSIPHSIHKITVFKCTLFNLTAIYMCHSALGGNFTLLG
jgi:hypothetical protein